MHLRLAVVVAALGLLAVASPASGSVLYDQSDNGAGEFAASNESSSTEVADDFIVPQGEIWRLGRIDLYGSSPCACFGVSQANVRIYADANHLPGALRFGAAENVSSNGSSYYIPLEQPGPPKFPVIAPGHYWLSIQLPGGWGWATRNVRSGDPASLRSPSCPGWAVRTSCAATPTQPDQTFWISGISEREAEVGKPFVRRSGRGFVPLTVRSGGTAEIRDHRATSKSRAGVRPRIKPRAIPLGSPADTFFTVRLPILPTGRTNRKLEHGRKVKVRTRITFTPDNGDPYSQTVSVTLKKQPN
jgi:hypothetical protein